MAPVSRVIDRLEEIYAIGATRVGGSAEEDAAHRLLASWLDEAGLDVATDGAGNTFGRRGGPAVWTGSHLDSVPGGGRFDGALGVVAAVEAALRIDAPIGVVAFRDEERGCAGSRAFVAAGRLPRAFVELHVEQGPLLDQSDAPLGLVTAIYGQARGEVVFEGRADHAGTTPMEVRDDALVKAAQFVLHVRASAPSGTVATVGRIEVEPGATNVVPSRATVSIDARAATPQELDGLVRAIGFEPGLRTEPVTMDAAVMAALRAAAPRALELVSGAGHDAAILGAAGVPVGMLFVRSLNRGASHSSDELSSEADIELGVAALATAVDTLARDLTESGR
jgi:acetylornithine deacetylase/succinyl-diaminopimelate desuccinylase-like protein